MDSWMYKSFLRSSSWWLWQKLVISTCRGLFTLPIWIWLENRGFLKLFIWKLCKWSERLL